MLFLHFLEHGIESVDSFLIRFFTVGYPIVAPGEDGDATVDTFFSARSTAVNDLVGPGPGVCPDDPGEREAPEQYGDTERY